MGTVLIVTAFVATLMIVDMSPAFLPSVRILHVGRHSVARKDRGDRIGKEDENRKYSEEGLRADRSKFCAVAI